MRLRFCGSHDVPEWVLQEIVVLSRLSSVRVKLLCGHITANLLGQGTNQDKIIKLTTAQRLNFTLDEVKAIVALLHFILSSAAKYNVEPDILSKELQQLGLPKDISRAIVRSYASSLAQLRDFFRNRTLSMKRVKDVHWRVDYILGSAAMPDLNMGTVRLVLSSQKQTDKSSPAAATEQSIPSPPIVATEMTVETFRMLYAELRQAKALMESMS
eukprot:GABV01002327.1.p1 GENE.GABV01002327.1~~GABV01002327.1.p1  ORF type:complete len:214 (-),score=54.88 GABV01002327.1:33-674(-)